MHSLLLSYQKTQVSRSTHDSLGPFIKDSNKEVKIANANNGERFNDGTWSGHHSVIDVDSDGVVRDTVSFQVY